VEANAQGFQSLVHDKVTVDAMASIALNMTLSVGSTTTLVEVTGAGSGGTTCYSCDEGSSSYNSMQVSSQRYLSAGLTAQLGYTFAKEIDDVQNTTSQIGAIGDANLGHWQWSGIYPFETGFSIGVTGTHCQMPGIVSNRLVNLASNFNGNVILFTVGSGNARTGVYLNKAAFADPASLTFGNDPRSASDGLTNPADWEIDSTLRRTFPVYENINIQLTADFFNPTKNVIFAPQATNIDSATFGTVTTTQNSPAEFNSAVA
jgi:hypothetical protein